MRTSVRAQKTKKSAFDTIMLCHTCRVCRVLLVRFRKHKRFVKKYPTHNVPSVCTHADGGDSNMRIVFPLDLAPVTLEYIRI